MATSYSDQVQKVYIAYYGRAADPVGLAYWAGKVETDGLAGIMASFGASAEATTLYGSLTSDTAKVNALYQQTFGRDADFAGLMYYAGQLSAGTMTAVSIAQNIFDGAAGTDATILANKLIVAKAYTAAIDTASEVVAYSGTVAAASARALLTTVDAATVTATFDVATSVASVVTVSSATPSVAGQTINLTTSVETVDGGLGDDTINATSTYASNAVTASATYNAGDIINGGAGTDAFVMSISGALVPSSASLTPTLTGVETVSVRNYETEAGATESLTIDLSLADASLATVGTIASTNVNADTIFSNIGQSVDLVMAGKGEMTVTYASGVNAGIADSANITLNDVGTVAATVSILDLSSIETLNITSSTSANFVDLANQGFTTITVAGDKAIHLEVSDTDVVSIDASSASGAVTLDTTDITMSGLTTIKGGSGAADVLEVDEAVTVTGATSATNSLFAASGFETLLVDNSGGTITVALSTADLGISKFDFTSTQAQTLTLNTGYTGATTVSIGDGDTVTNTANIALTVNAKSNVFDNSTTVTGGTGTVDTINITAVSSTVELDSVTLIEQINVLPGTVGTEDVTIDVNSADATVASGKTLTVDASALTNTGAVLTFTGTGETNGYFDVTGGAGNDSLTGGSAGDTLSGGAGVDSINGGAGNDTLSGGDGIDTITANAGIDSVTGGAGNDILIFGANLTADDTVDGGAGTDSLRVSVVSASAMTGVTNVENLQVTSAATVSLASDLSFDSIDLKTSTSSESVTFTTGYLKATTVSVEGGDSVTNTGADIVLTVSADSDDLAAADNTMLTGSDKTGVINTLTVTNTTGTIDMASTGDIGGFDVLNIVDHSSTTGNDVTVNLTSYASALTIDASTLDSGEVLTISGASAKALNVTGGAGADVLALGVGADTIDGGAGNDTFTAGTSITYADTLAGGAGTDTMTATDIADIDLTNVTGIETLTVAGTTAAASLGAQASAAGIATVNTTSGTNQTVDAAAMTTNVTFVAGGADIETITGGTGDDTFVFQATESLLYTDVLNGTSGTDTIRLDNDDDADATGDAVTATIDAISNIDKIVINDTATDNTAGDVTITVTDNSGEAGIYDQTTLTIDGSALDAGEVLTFSATANTATDEAFVVLAGGGADVLTGGAGNDTITGGAGADTIDGNLRADTLTGGAGSDTFVYAEGDSGSANADTITDFAAGADKITMTIAVDNSGANNTINTTDTGDATSLINGLSLLAASTQGQMFFNTTASQLAIDLDGNGLIQSNDMVINMTDETGFSDSDIEITVVGGSAVDTITTGGGNDSIRGAAGADVIVAGAGDDTITYLTTGALFTSLASVDTTITGGDGTDVLSVGTSGTAFAIANNDSFSGITTVETIKSLANSAAVTIALDSTAQAAGINKVDLSLASKATGNSIDVDEITTTAMTLIGSAAGVTTITGGDATDSITGGTAADVFIASTGNDVVTGNNGADDFKFTTALLAANSATTATFTGGNGADEIIITDAGTTVVDADFRGFATIESLTLANGINTVVLGTIAQAAGILTVNGGTGIDTITTGAGAQTIDGGVGADIINVTAEAAVLDIIVMNAGDTVLTIGGSGDSGTIAGFDVVTGMAAGDATNNSDNMNVSGTGAIVANTAGIDGTDSTLTIGGTAVKSHAIASGVVTFDDADTFSAALTLTSAAHVAAVVQYLQLVDLGTTGSSVIFDVGADNFLYTQGDAGGTNGLDNVVKLIGVQADALIVTNGVGANDLFIS